VAFQLPPAPPADESALRTPCTPCTQHAAAWLALSIRCPPLQRGRCVGGRVADCGESGGDDSDGGEEGGDEGGGGEGGGHVYGGIGGAEADGRRRGGEGEVGEAMRCRARPGPPRGVV
jgi:hypothetical protein